MLFGYLAGVAPRLELVTGVIILPQRQTALVAKQAAEVDILTGGRFRLGVGIGWNAVEYEALGKNFPDRGRRCEEQIELLRRLWTEPVVTFDGRYERVTGAGLAPLPVQRPIPVWIGAASTAGLRAGRPAGRRVVPDDAAGTRTRRGARRSSTTPPTAAGRDPSAIGMEGRVNWTGDADRPARARRPVARWRAPRTSVGQHDGRRAARPSTSTWRC